MMLFQLNDFPQYQITVKVPTLTLTKKLEIHVQQTGYTQASSHLYTINYNGMLYESSEKTPMAT